MIHVIDEKAAIEQHIWSTASLRPVADVPLGARLLIAADLQNQSLWKLLIEGCPGNGMTQRSEVKHELRDWAHGCWYSCNRMERGYPAAAE